MLLKVQFQITLFLAMEEANFHSIGVPTLSHSNHGLRSQIIFSSLDLSLETKIEIYR